MGDPLERLESEGEAGPVESSMEDELCMEIDPLFRDGGATAEDWRKALDKVVPAVVVLRATACRAFDTESAGSGYATGFVVDKRRGIILTNRHVVKPGPIVGEAMFLNREEIPVYPIYRDPVHDFGFFRYDPAAIQFLSYEEIPLAPDAACVGLEIRVVGNDSGEKAIIILASSKLWIELAYSLSQGCVGVDFSIVGDALGFPQRWGGDLLGWLEEEWGKGDGMSGD
ncbi:Protease Do-like 7 [Sarracenia purpurea var. burkii]